LRAAGLIPSWARGYRRAFLRPDVVAGVVVWSVVAPQALAYAQIAGLPPEAGLMAAPGALLAYAWLGTSRSLIVSATTATSAVSAAAVGPLAGGDVAKFAALSAALALVTAAVLALAGWLRFGAIADLISKPVMTGFMFGLGLTIAMEQLPALLGLPGAEGSFFDRIGALARHLGDADGATAAVGAASVALLVASRRLWPRVPAPLLVLSLAIALSALLDLHGHGVDTVGEIPQALPDPALPDVSANELVNLIAPSLGVLVVTAEAIGVARALASAQGARVEPNRDLVALGAANLLGGLSSGFVQSGGASQTAAADEAGGRTQLVAVVCAGLILLTGAFLGALFTDLPQATLSAIVIVAVSGFWDVAELRRFARVRRSAIVFAGLAIFGVLGLGVLQGLIVTAGLSLVYLVRLLARVTVHALARDPDTGAWERRSRHPGWPVPDGVLAVRNDGPLFYANVLGVKDHVLELADATRPPVTRIVLDLGASPGLDVQTADTLADLAREATRRDATLWLTQLRAPARETLERAGLLERLHVAPSLDDAAGLRPRAIV
jgi:high affinity sulfate transporter 1